MDAATGLRNTAPEAEGGLLYSMASGRLVGKVLLRARVRPARCQRVEKKKNGAVSS
jgi:hypothetical protein